MEKQVAWSTFQVKALDEERREFSGIASTPTPDRAGDIVEPHGATFKLPLPLLSGHDKSKPIGEVIAATITAKGIEYTARIARVLEDGTLKQRVDEAWQEIKYGIVRGVSIGFLPNMEAIERLKSGGLRFKSWEWFELSTVAIPANAEATIARIKSIATGEPAASGQAPTGGGNPDLPGASGKKTQTVNYSRKTPTMNVQEQLKALQAKRDEFAAERTAIQTKAVDEGRTKDASESERFDEIGVELTKIDKELKDLNVLAAEQITKAAPVNGTSTQGATAARSGSSYIQVKDNRIRGEGIAVAQYAKCIFKAQGNKHIAQQIAEADQRLDPRVNLMLKAAIAPGTTQDPTWIGALVSEEGGAMADFVEFLRPQTIIGRIPGLRNAPLRTPFVGQTSGGAGYWVGEGQAKPLTKFDFERTTLVPLKVANIAVLTMEAMRDSSPAADVLVRDGLVAALRERLDIDFVDPAKAAVADISPASITNGVTPIASSGTDGDAVRADIRALLSTFIAAKNPPTSGVWIMNSVTAMSLGMMQNALGQAEFPGVGMTGGTFNGMPVVVSDYVPGDTGGSIVILANASDIYLADEGGFQVDMSQEASLQMTDTPDNPTTATTVVVNLWQNNLVGFRAERSINWKKRRPSAVAYLSGVTWGA